MEDAFRDAELSADVVHLGTGLMLLAGCDELFFTVAPLHCDIS